MPEIGEIKRKNYEKYIWQACIDCGKKRWVKLVKNQPIDEWCFLCGSKRCGQTRQGEKSRNWKGGRHHNGRGYILIKLQPDDFFYPMCVKSRGDVLEHRLVVAKALGRCLHRWEIVHHKEGCAKDDNRYPETLQLVTDDRHKQITILENRISFLEKRVTLLEAENILLKVEVPK